MPESKDQAQVIISSPLNLKQMEPYLDQLPLLFSVNPFYKIKNWQQEAHQVSFEVNNLQSGQRHHYQLQLHRQPNHVRVYYDQGIKAYTDLRLHAVDEGSELIITEDYSRLPESERQKRLQEVDQSLLPWAHALRRFFKQIHRWSWLPVWSYWIRFWFSMNPNQRMVSRIIIWATVIEFVIFLLLWGQYVSNPS